MYIHGVYIQLMIKDIKKELLHKISILKNTILSINHNVQEMDMI